jgi:molybdenum cofactor sulfurtransferase
MKDHAGTTLPSEELIATLSESLVKDASWMANPHSGHSMAQKTQMVISNARERSHLHYHFSSIYLFIDPIRILGHFGVDSSTYSVVFTANTTAALKLVAECFDFGEVPNALCERSISSDLRHLLGLFGILLKIVSSQLQMIRKAFF